MTLLNFPPCAFSLGTYQNSYGGLTAPIGDKALFQGFPSDDQAAVQSAQSVNHQALGVDPTNLNAESGPVQVVNRQALSGSSPSQNVALVAGSNQGAMSLLPPATGVSFSQPQSYVGGHLDNYMANLEHGNSQSQTEQMSALLPPPHVPGPPSPPEEYQGGDLHVYSSSFAHGDHAQETEERGQPPYRPYYVASRVGGAVGGVAEAPVALAPLSPQRVFYPPGSVGLDPRTYYLFMTGQLPRGTYTHASATHDAGGDHYGEAHYERFDLQPMPIETQEVAQDMGVHQSHLGRKGY